MAVGKYSPTVSAAYGKDQSWHDRNGGDDAKNWADPYDGRDYDKDGYDSYGYNCDDIDRAGNHEDDYLQGRWLREGVLPITDPSEYDSADYVHVLFETVLTEWTFDQNGVPALR